MKVSSQPTWLATLPKKLQKTYPALKKDISVNVCVIGAGLTGIATAYMLNQHGLKVAVLEKGTYKDSVTAYTTAFLTQVIDTNLQDLVKMFGKKEAKLIWSSHQKAIDLVAQIVKREKIDCDFVRCDDYSVAQSAKDAELLQKEVKIAKKLGFPVTFETKSNLGFDNYGYMLVPDQAKFHPMKYLQTLKAICVKNGVELYEKTEALRIKKARFADASARREELKMKNGEEHQAELHVETSNAVVTANHVLIATYDPFNHPLKLFGRRGMYTSYILEAEIPPGILTEGIYEDQDNPYNYWRVDKNVKKGKDGLIIGGQDHRHEIPLNEKKAYAAIEDYIKKLIPNQKYTITHQWSGPILEPSDGLACIGKFSDDNIYVAMAFSGNGMTYAHIAYMLLTDQILGKKNAWEEIYNPTRIPTVESLLQKGVDYGEELFKGVTRNF